MAKIIELLHFNPYKIFNLPANDDLVLADIKNYRCLSDEQLATKVKWSPFSGMQLTGFPRLVCTQGHLLELGKLA